MRQSRTLVITGIGGQGIVYLVKLLCEAALSAGIQVGASEIHGLSQRGGSVNACMVFGQSASTLLGPGEADYLIGLEPLEAQRNQGFLHRDSRAVIDTRPVYPFSVNSGSARYPRHPFIYSITAHPDRPGLTYRYRTGTAGDASLTVYPGASIDPG